MARRRIGSGIVAVGIVAALTGAVAYTTMGDSEVEAVPVVESAAPIEPRITPPDAVPEAQRGDARTSMAPPEAPQLLEAGLPTLSPSMAAAASPSAAKSQYTVPAVDLPTGALLSQPVSGRKTSRFGNRFHPILRVWKLHTGLDWAAACGTPVGAAAAGKVTKVGWAGGNGMQVRVDHGQLGGHHVVTTYNHLSAVGVRVGQQVAVHQGVGLVGNTGYSTGCHLHFEVIANGWFTNPEQWLNGESVVIDTTGMNNQSIRPTTTPSPTPTGTPTPSPTPSVTDTPTPSPTPTTTPTDTPSPTPTASPSSPSGCTSPTSSPSSQPSLAPTADPSCVPEPEPTCTPDPDATPDAEPCNSPAPTEEPTGQPTETPSPSPDPTESPSGSTSPSPDPTESPSGTTSPSPDPTDSPSGGDTPTPSTSASISVSPSATGGDASPSSTVGLSASSSPSGDQSATHTPDATPTATSESTATIE